MRIPENFFHFPQLACLSVASSWRCLSSPLQERVSIAFGGLLTWARKRFEWIVNFFFCLLWPRASVLEPAVLPLKETQKTPVGALARGKGSEAASATFEQLCKNPYGLYTGIKASRENSFSSYYDLSLSFFKLCPCKKVVPWMRLSLEEEVIAKMQKLYPDKDEPITVVSVGAGGLYQELVYLAKLVHAGYKKVAFFAIDTDPTHCPIGRLSLLCKEVLDDKVNAEEPLYLSLRSYQEAAKDRPNLRPDLLLCIDLSDQRFNVNKKPLSDHAFSLLQQSLLLKETTLIAHSFLETSSSSSHHNIVAKAVCVQNTLGEENLHALQKRKWETEKSFEFVLK